MPKVPQKHLDARRQQILDAARSRFASHGFAGTSLADIVAESGLSNGSIYRYFAKKEDIVRAVCEQGGVALPTALTLEAVTDFLENVRLVAREQGHARLVAQIYAEAALSPSVAAVVADQLSALRAAIATLVAARGIHSESERIAEAFVAICVGYNQQLAIRGDVDSAPFARALIAVIDD